MVTRFYLVYFFSWNQERITFQFIFTLSCLEQNPGPLELKRIWLAPPSPSHFPDEKLGLGVEKWLSSPLAPRFPLPGGGLRPVLSWACLPVGLLQWAAHQHQCPWVNHALSGAEGLVPIRFHCSGMVGHAGFHLIVSVQVAIYSWDGCGCPACQSASPFVFLISSLSLAMEYKTWLCFPAFSLSCLF